MIVTCGKCGKDVTKQFLEKLKKKVKDKRPNIYIAKKRGEEIICNCKNTNKGTIPLIGKTE